MRRPCWHRCRKPQAFGDHHRSTPTPSSAATVRQGGGHGVRRRGRQSAGPDGQAGGPRREPARTSDGQLPSRCNDVTGNRRQNEIPASIKRWSGQYPLTGADSAMTLLRCSGWEICADDESAVGLCPLRRWCPTPPTIRSTAAGAPAELNATLLRAGSSPDLCRLGTFGHWQQHSARRNWSSDHRPHTGHRPHRTQLVRRKAPSVPPGSECPSCSTVCGRQQVDCILFPPASAQRVIPMIRGWVRSAMVLHRSVIAGVDAQPAPTTISGPSISRLAVPARLPGVCRELRHGGSGTCR